MAGPPCSGITVIAVSASDPFIRRAGDACSTQQKHWWRLHGWTTNIPQKARILINHAPHKRVSNVISLCQTQGNRRACSTALSLFGNKFLTITQERNQTLSLLLLPNNHSWEGRSGHHSSLRCTAEAAQRQLKNHRTEHLHMVVGKMRSSDLLAVLEG